LKISVGASNNNTLSKIQKHENQQQQNETIAAINNDPFVRDLIEDLDARMQSSTIKPVP